MKIRHVFIYTEAICFVLLYISILLFAVIANHPWIPLNMFGELIPELIIFISMLIITLILLLYEMRQKEDVKSE